MTNIEFVNQLKKAVNSKTLYVMGCFGAPMTQHNKERWKREQRYNQREVRSALIDKASADTFGFDCVNLVKAVLWGWDANTNHVYGGCRYQSNGMPDTTIDAIYRKHCTEQSTDFSKIEVGEFLIMPGHCGVYIGDGKAIEATPKWDDGVQITEVWNIRRETAKGRVWQAHAKLNIEYVTEKRRYTIAVIVPENTTDREIDSTREELQKMGFDPIIYTERR